MPHRRIRAVVGSLLVGGFVAVWATAASPHATLVAAPTDSLNAKLCNPNGGVLAAAGLDTCVAVLSDKAAATATVVFDTGDGLYGASLDVLPSGCGGAVASGFVVTPDAGFTPVGPDC